MNINSYLLCRYFNDKLTTQYSILLRGSVFFFNEKKNPGKPTKRKEWSDRISVVIGILCVLSSKPSTSVSGFDIVAVYSFVYMDANVLNADVVISINNHLHFFFFFCIKMIFEIILKSPWIATNLTFATVYAYTVNLIYIGTYQSLCKTVFPCSTCRDYGNFRIKHEGPLHSAKTVWCLREQEFTSVFPSWKESNDRLYIRAHTYLQYIGYWVGIQFFSMPFLQFTIFIILYIICKFITHDFFFFLILDAKV